MSAPVIGDVVLDRRQVIGSIDSIEGPTSVVGLESFELYHVVVKGQQCGGCILRIVVAPADAQRIPPELLGQWRADPSRFWQRV